MKATDSNFTGKQRYNKFRAPLYLTYIPEELDGYDFGSEEFVEAVKSLQSDLGLKEDGLVGPKTVETIAKRNSGGICTEEVGENGLYLGSQFSEFNSDQTITHLNDFRLGELPSKPRTKDIDKIVLHYDVSFDASLTVEVLKDRGLSTHFIIDGDDDATVYQLMDPATQVAYHARGVNSTSIGIDLNNPVEVKYGASDEKNRGRGRDVVEFEYRGEVYRYLDYFDNQIDQLALLIEILADTFDIELNHPGHDNLMSEEEIASFKGILGHFHVSKQKQDPKPLDFDELFSKIEG